MEKMREEFEAWHIKQCEADGMDLRDIRSELDRNGDGYVYIGAQYAWAGWKASRAALCVELPSKMRSEPLSLYDIGFNDGIDGAIECIEEAGVSHK